MTSPDRRPGREGAVEALVAAARALFAERGPAAVSLRDVARAAGVNHGLIHHYIGSRDDLLRLVIDTSMEQARREVDGAADAGDAVSRLRRLGAGGDEYTRLLAWALLEGYDPAELQGRSSALEAAVAAGGVDTPDVRAALAAAVVQTLGWKLFGRFALAAAGLGCDDGPAVGARLDEATDQMLAQAAGAGEARR